jgi:hypothetical protein
MIDYKNSYIGKNLNSLSQAGNTLSDGDIDVSISGRIGHNMIVNPTKFWKACRWVVDGTFWIIEGVGHCERAYEIDIGEVYTAGGKWYWLTLLSIFIITVCSIMLIPFSIYKLIKFVKKIL